VGVIQGISRSIINPVPGRVVSTLDSIQKRTIAAAFRSLDFNPSHADAFASWYIGRNASLAGVVQDETPNRDHSRPELTARATSFNGTNQRFTSDFNTSSGKTAFTAAIWVNVASNVTGELHNEYEVTGDDRGWRIYLAAGKPFVVLSSDGTFDNSACKKVSADETIPLNVWNHVAFTWSVTSDEVLIFVNGKQVSTTATSNTTIASIFNATENYQIGAYASGGSGWLTGSLAHPYISESALTPAQVRDLNLNKLDSVPTPDHGWLLDGDKAWTIAGDSVLSPSNVPTRLESEDIPVSANDFNHAGYGTTAYKVDFADGFQGWIASSGEAYRELVAFEGKDALKFIAPDEGGGFASSERLEKAFNDNYLIDGESYTLKFDLYIPSSNTDLAKVRWTASQLNAGDDIEPTPDVWESFEITGLTADTSQSKLRAYAVQASGALSAIPAGDVFYLANVEIISETESAGWFPAQWGSNTTASNGYPLTYSGEVARNGTLLGGPCVELNGTNQYGVITNSDDYSDEDWVLSGYCSSEITGTRLIVAQASGTGAGRSWFGQSTTDRKWFTGIGNVTNTFDGITPIVGSREYYFEFAHDASAETLTLTVTDLTTDTTETETLTSINMESADSDLIIGTNKLMSGNFWDGNIWGLKLDCTTNPTKSFNCPISEESGDTSFDISGNGKDIAWQNSPSLSGTQNSYFHGEHFGCNSVPIFVDGVELISSTINGDGIKQHTVEIDFVPADFSTGMTLYTVGSVSPFRIQTQTSGVLTVGYRNIAGAITSANSTDFLLTVGEIYRLKFVFTEDEDNPTTASSIVVTDRLTGDAFYSWESIDLGLSDISNSGPPQIGNYATATQTFTGDIYRVRHWVGDLLSASVDFPSFANAGDENDFSESGGTLDIKKIPAKEDGSQTDANGYPIQNTNPAHKNTQATLQGYLANSDSEADIYYGCEFDGTLDANINADTNITGFPFTLKANITSTASAAQEFVFLSPTSSQYFGIRQASGRDLRIMRRGGGVGPENTTTSFTLVDGVSTDVEVTFLSATELTVTVDGVTEAFEAETSVTFPIAAGDGDLYIGQQRNSLGNSPEFEIKNVVVKQGDPIVNDHPLYKDALDRSPNCFHGSLSATGVSFLNNPASEIAALNPTIANTETLAQTDGNKKLILLGSKI